MLHSIHELAEDVRRQVKKNRELRRGRERTRRVLGRPARRHRLTGIERERLRYR